MKVSTFALKHKEMQQTLEIQGMTCSGCVKTIQEVLGDYQGIKNVKVNLDPPTAVIESTSGLDAEVLNNILVKAGNYRISQSSTTSITSKVTYFPLILILLFLLSIVGIAQWNHGIWDSTLAMKHFMGGFFLTFSFFKLLDLPGFARSYANYDLLAGKSKLYGYAYPFLELSLGIAYISPLQSNALHWFTLVLMVVSALGVLQGILKKKTIQCACLGTVFQLPMSTVTLVEDLLMVLMAAAMLLH